MNYWRYNPEETCDHFLTIDLRTYPEVEACPAKSDIVLNIPQPPMPPEVVGVLAEKLYQITHSMSPQRCIKIFCAKGKRSAVAVAILKQAGFENIIDLGGVECK